MEVLEEFNYLVWEILFPVQLYKAEDQNISLEGFLNGPTIRTSKIPIQKWPHLKNMGMNSSELELC